MKMKFTIGETKVKLGIDQDTGMPTDAELVIGESLFEQEIPKEDYLEIAKLYITQGAEFRKNFPLVLQETKAAILDFMKIFEAFSNGKASDLEPTPAPEQPVNNGPEYDNQFIASKPVHLKVTTKPMVDKLIEKELNRLSKKYEGLFLQVDQAAAAKENQEESCNGDCGNCTDDPFASIISSIFQTKEEPKSKEKGSCENCKDKK